MSELGVSMYIKKSFWGKHYLINDNNEKIGPFVYISKDKINGGYYIIDNNKYGHLDDNGNVVIPCFYDFILRYHKGFIVQNDGKWGYLNSKGHCIIACKYEDLSFWFDNWIYKLNGKYGVFDEKCNPIIPCEYDEVEPIGEFLRVKKDNTYGLFDKFGKEIFACKFENIELNPYFSGFNIKEEGSWHFYNENTECINKYGVEENQINKIFNLSYGINENKVIIFAKYIEKIKNINYLKTVKELITESVKIQIKNSKNDNFEKLIAQYKLKCELIINRINTIIKENAEHQEKNNLLDINKKKALQNIDVINEKYLDENNEVKGI